jgi:parallel beta-helix repeat protein
MTVTATTIDDNFAYGSGGGIFLSGSGTNLISSTTISNNEAQIWGGGLFASGSDQLIITNSTISGNIRASGPGSAMRIQASNATLRLSTVTGEGFGVIEWFPFCPPSAACTQFAVGGSVLDTTSDVCSFPVTSLGYNIASDTTCGLTATGDVQDGDPMLGALAENGGPTHTHLPQPGSPAIDRIPDGTAGLCDGSLPSDQRGIARPQGGACDSGAVEV